MSLRNRSSSAPSAAIAALTLQAVSEFYAAVTRKRVLPRQEAAAQAATGWRCFHVPRRLRVSVRSALAEATAGRASYWDALLVATAREAGCAVLLTEDLSDETDFGGVRIHNPFSPSGGLNPLARRLLGLDYDALTPGRAGLAAVGISTPKFARKPSRPRA